MAEEQMKNGALKTGELLVREGLIRREEIDNALSIQSVETGEGKVPLGRLLVKKGLISRTQILELAQHPLVLEGAGKLALEKGLVTQEQFEKASIDFPGGRTPGERLVAQGHLGVETLKRLVLELLDSRELAGYLTALSLVSAGEIRGILDTFRYPRSIGGILCDMNLVDPGTLYRLLARHGKLMKLGELLVKLFGIHRREVEKALVRKESGSPMPLGRVLVENNVITEEQLNFALSRQCNLPFEELTGFSFSESSASKLSGLVPAEFASSGGIVPVSLEGSILTTAVSVPGCLLSMERLSAENPFLRVRCILISDRRFSELFSSLYGNAGSVSHHGTGKRLVAAAVCRKTDSVPGSSMDVLSGSCEPSRGADVLPIGADIPPRPDEAFSVGEHSLAGGPDLDQGTELPHTAGESSIPVPDALTGEMKTMPHGTETLPVGSDTPPLLDQAFTAGEHSLTGETDLHQVSDTPRETSAPVSDAVETVPHGTDALLAGMEAMYGGLDEEEEHGQDALSAGLDAFYGFDESQTVGAGSLSDDLPAGERRATQHPAQRGSEAGPSFEEAPAPPAGGQQTEPEFGTAFGDEREHPPAGFDKPERSAAMEAEPREPSMDSGKEPAKNGRGDLPEKSNVVFLPVMEMEISDPEKEEILIERMYRGYESLRGGEATLSELSLFRDFITENHKRICDTFLCATVKFNMERHGEKVMIQATPGRIG